MTTSLAHLYATACLATVFFQVALMMGLPLGRYTQGGHHAGALPLRGRVVAAVSIPVWLFMGLAILSAAGFPGLGWPQWTGWVTLAVQGITALLTGMTPSPQERAVWAPVTLVMFAIILVVMTA